VERETARKFFLAVLFFGRVSMEIGGRDADVDVV
jgi:hypothetical protein